MTDLERFYDEWFESRYDREADWYLPSKAEEFGESFKTALGLDWEFIRSEFVRKVIDDDGDHVEDVTHIWEWLPFWGAYRDYDRHSITLKGMDKAIRSVWSATSIQEQFSRKSAIFDKLTA